jgi:hypothetical protein
VDRLEPDVGILIPKHHYFERHGNAVPARRRSVVSSSVIRFIAMPYPPARPSSVFSVAERSIQGNLIKNSSVHMVWDRVIVEYRLAVSIALADAAL